ncbi:MAG: DUF192 domain-containing protein [Armatimonadota bacterium]
MMINKRNELIIASRIETAFSIYSRLKGLIGRKAFLRDSAFIIPGCKQVHTCFMRFPIDIVFINKRNEVIHIQESTPPYSITNYIRNASSVIELPAGKVADKKITIGDIITIKIEVS